MLNCQYNINDETQNTFTLYLVQSKNASSYTVDENEMYLGKYIFTCTGNNKMSWYLKQCSYFHLYNSTYTLNILNMNNDVKMLKKKYNYPNLKIMNSD